MRSRGSAIVEVLLAVPFLFLFALAMQDFARGFISGQRAQRAARHLAWSAGRHEDDPSAPAAPTKDAIFELHYRKKGGSITTTVAATNVNSGLGGLLSGETESDLGAMDGAGFDIFGNFGRGVMTFLTGEVEGTAATVEQTVTGIRKLTTGAIMGQTHYVSLRSRREEHPAQRYGWWDPYMQLKDQITGAIK